MDLIKLTDDIFVDPDQIVSIEKMKKSFEGGDPREPYTVVCFDGSLITLKNGAQIEIDKVNPTIIKQMIESSK